MAKKTPELSGSEKNIIEMLSYKATEPYFGWISAKLLHAAHKRAKDLQKAAEKGQDISTDPPATIDIERFTTNDIVESLKAQMYYNPHRWAQALELLDMGLQCFLYYENRNHSPTKRTITIKARKKGKPDKTKEVLTLYGALYYANEKIKNRKIVYENDRNVVFPTGKLEIAFKTNGRTDERYQTFADTNYQMLAQLFHAFREVCEQNVADFKDKDYPYRDEMIQIMHKTDPAKVRLQDFGYQLADPEHPEKPLAKGDALELFDQNLNYKRYIWTRFNSGLNL
ncbi:MAG: hypothetical protein FWC51_02585 [Proteobacteria bacterium]|nr:hypothetical protein [Pseudomonadota bacterium]